jgi:broad specificity phosphatase PhoE/predicted kinase
LSYRRGQKYVLVLVGLPARGKSYTSRRLARYLRWQGYATRVFNVGEKRRIALGGKQPASFFDPRNPEGREALQAIAAASLEDLVAWLDGEGRIAILDATNSTRARRAWVKERCVEKGFEVFFIELVNDDPDVIEANVRATKVTSPDYAGMDPERAVADFRQRIAHYASTYEPVGDDEGAYIKLIDRMRKIQTNRIDGYIPARIVFFLLNLQISERPVFLTRHGQSLDNLAGRIGGDSSIAPAGHEYARELAKHFDQRLGRSAPLHVWSSALRRTIETAEPLGREVRQWRSLNEIQAGVCDGWTYEEIRERMPGEWEGRKRDKLRYRYPRGESYEDVISRLDKVLVEIERHREPVLVIAHQAVLRALYAYFVELPPERIPHVEIPLHTLIVLTPRAYDCVEQRLVLPPFVEQKSSRSA